MKLQVDDYIEEAREFCEEALKEFEEGYHQGKEMIMRDACEKGWNAVVQATSALFLKKGIEKLPKSHKERRDLLREIEKRDEEVKKVGLVDRFMARDNVLHMRGFYNGIIEASEVIENLKKVKMYIEDIEKISESSGDKYLSETYPTISITGGVPSLGSYYLHSRSMGVSPCDLPWTLPSKTITVASEVEVSIPSPDSEAHFT